MWHARPGGPRTPSKTADANLDCAFVENALVFVAPKIGRAWARLAPLFGTIHLLSMTTSKAPSAESSLSSSSKTIDRVLDFLWKFQKNCASFYNATLPEHELPVEYWKLI